MTRCLLSDEPTDACPPLPVRTDGLGPEPIDVDYFLRRPRGVAIEHRSAEGPGQRRTLRMRLAPGPATAAVSAAR